eukprot:TRINITY_DN10920_c0_g1_i2.p1 TRINITY_DN10920_c0_g1~~TRINITY_DN10920_c0_g1_i2.p1  ORF type:complete len:378 (-),score=32.62 TRINITY_DN10920_c0_g1_i2:1164-2297(-)
MFLSIIRRYSSLSTRSKKSILGIPRSELVAEFKQLEIPQYRALQVFQWLYRHGVESFASMTNIPPSLLGKLSEIYSLQPAKVLASQHSSDGTIKWASEFDNAASIESVYIPETKQDRGTICVSSQAGCTVGCTFCATGAMGAGRNLTSGEILTQFQLARRQLGDLPLTETKPRRLTNLVFMGMGEPLYNIRNIERAVSVLTDPEGCAFGHRRITLSTSGVVPHMARAVALGVRLAVSLHAVTDELRNELVPINKLWPLHEVLDACRNALDSNHRITFEYCLLKGVNDDEASARALPKLLHGIPSLVNLIPFNPWPGSAYEAPSDETVKQFARLAAGPNVETTIRWSRGQDIQAACGQLQTQIRNAGIRLREKTAGGC